MLLANLLAPRRAAPAASRVTHGGSVATPQDWLVKLLGGGKTAAGMTVNEKTAMNFAAVFSAVNIYCNAIITLPFVLYERLPNGGKREAVGHPIWRLLHHRPNGEMPASEFWSFMEACKLLWGNGYAEIERDRAGRPIGLWPIHPSRVSVKRAREGGPIVYEVSGTRTVTIQQADMIHIKGLSTDGLTGMSVVTAARESLGLSLASERHGAKFFGNCATPGGILKRSAEADELSEPASRRMRESWVEMVGGDNAYLPALLEEGTEFQTIGMPNKDSQFLETREFQVREVARWFVLPPHKLGVLSDATFSNIEQQQMEYVTESLMPQLVVIQNEVSFKLFSEAELTQYKAEWNVLGLLRGDHASRSSFYKTMWEIGAYTINDILRLENRNPIGAEGDLHFVQLNLTTVEKMAAELAKPAEDQATEALLAFKREVVKAYLADGTTNDVMFNLTKVRNLLTDVDLPVQEGYEEPWMPVRDDAGQLVSGETIEDSGGDTVEGDVIRAEGKTAKGRPAGGDDDGAEAAAGVAMMPVLVEACERLVRKETAATTRAAKKHAGDDEAFGAWAAKFFEEHAEMIVTALAPGVQSLARLSGVQDADKLSEMDVLFRATARMWCELARDAAIVAFSGGTVDAWCEERSKAYPPSAASGFVEMVNAAVLDEATGGRAASGTQREPLPVEK